MVGTAIVGETAGFPGEAIASGYGAQSNTPPPEGGTLALGRVKVATENFAKFTFPEKDQTHEMFNNTWADTTSAHQAMIMTQWTADKIEATAAWDWPAWDKPYCHGYHAICHGLEPASGVNTDSRFPFPISRYGSLTLDIPNVYVVGDGKWQLAFDMFLFKDASSWSAGNVQAEIFIRVKAQNMGLPSIPVGSLTSCGVNYYCGQYAAGQTLYHFSRTDDPNVPFRQQINIYDFIRFLKEKGVARDSNILAGVYFGSEPIEGSGSWRIDSFYVTL